MTQGTINSLNLTLMRLNSIENSFSALERIGQSQSDIAQVESDKSEPLNFKTILDAKIKEAQDKTDILDDLKTVEEAVEIDDIDKKEKIIDAVNLKSKLDLSAQKANVDELIETFSNKYDIDSDFIKAIIKQESNFNSNATSKKGAMGLMQLMPATAKSLGVIDAYNPSQNIEGGVKYLKGLLDSYGNDKQLALAAYNAGSSAVKKYGGIPPYKETQNYVKSIMSAYEKIKEANL